MTEPRPSLRKPFGVFAILIYIAVYAVLVVSLAEPILRLPVLAQLPIWLVLGIIWAFPLKPVLRWIETGRLR